MAKYPAAFINAIAEEGTKQEAVQYLQETWDELMTLQNSLRRLNFSERQIKNLTKGDLSGSL